VTYSGKCSSPGVVIIRLVDKLRCCRESARATLIIIVGQAYAWPFSVFTPKQVFGPRTAKSQPICKQPLIVTVARWKLYS